MSTLRSSADIGFDTDQVYRRSLVVDPEYDMWVDATCRRANSKRSRRGRSLWLSCRSDGFYCYRDKNADWGVEKMSARERVLITGGAAGIGRATADRCRADGYEVVVIDREGNGIRADLSSPEATAAALEEALSGGPITRLVNN